MLLTTLTQPLASLPLRRRENPDSSEFDGIRLWHSGTLPRSVTLSALIQRSFVLVILSVLLPNLGLSESDSVFFRDRSNATGIDFQLENSPTQEKFLIETMTGGCAFLDYDGDGLLDIFLVNGASLHIGRKLPPQIDKSQPQYWNRLYRNLGTGRFQDVTQEAGVSGRGYGLGVAVGDYDNDGHPDLYVTNYGRNELYRNLGDGTFRDVTRENRCGWQWLLCKCRLL